MKNKWIKLAVAFVLCQGAGALGTVFTVSATSTWYLDLAKPVLNPPSWVFGPVWVALYTLMAIAVWRVWNKKEGSMKARRAFMLFWPHLALNALWTPVFFGLREIFSALMILLVLFVYVLYLIYLFGKADKSAAWLIAPYMLWVGFALYLNYEILILNL